jgi:hypothetical protein
LHVCIRCKWSFVLLQFGVEFISFCTEVAVMVMRREVSRVCQHGGNHANSSSVCCHSDDIDQTTAASLAQICRVAGRLYEQSPHMRVVSSSRILYSQHPAILGANSFRIVQYLFRFVVGLRPFTF